MNWTQAEVVALTGAKPSDVQNWVNRGYVQPVNEAPGKSGKRLYDFDGLVAIAAMHAGARSGLPANVVSNTLDEIAPRARRLLIGEALKVSGLVGDVNLTQSKILIYARIGDDWGVSEAELDEEGKSFDPSKLPDSFVVLQIDRMVRRLIVRTWPNGLNFDGMVMPQSESPETAG